MDRGTLSQLQQLVRPLAARISNTVARAVVQLVNDAKKLQLVQLGVLDGEDIDDSEHFQPYGFTSVPLPGAEAVVVFPGGDREHPLVVGVSDRRHRPTGGEPGEVTVYSHTGAMMKFTKDGDIELYPAPGREVRIGDAGAGKPPALAAELADLKSKIVAWTPVANDGGSSLKAVFSSWAVPGATKVKVE